MIAGKLPAPSLTKSAVRQLQNLTPDQAWLVLPLAAGSFVQACAPGLPGKFVVPSRVEVVSS